MLVARTSERDKVGGRRESDREAVFPSVTSKSHQTLTHRH